MINFILLSKYGPIISDKVIGEDIYKEVKSALSNNNDVIVDFSEIKSMATFNAKQIFGRLYLELGSENFYEKIDLKNTSPELKLIIRMGIQNALDERAIN
jgi:hypothetical protein